MFALLTVGFLCATVLAQPVTAGVAMPPHVPLQKAIGQAKTDVVPSLIVFNSRGATLQGGKLILSGIAPDSRAAMSGCFCFGLAYDRP